MRNLLIPVRASAATALVAGTAPKHPMTDRMRFRAVAAAGLIALGLAPFSASPADAAKKPKLECSADWEECFEYCDRAEKPVGGAQNKTCKQACTRVYEDCTGEDVQDSNNPVLYTPGTSPGLYDTGGPGSFGFQFQSPLPTKKTQ